MKYQVRKKVYADGGVAVVTESKGISATTRTAALISSTLVGEADTPEEAELLVQTELNNIAKDNMLKAEKD